MWRNRHICTKFLENRHIFGSTKKNFFETLKCHIKAGMWHFVTKMWLHIFSSPSLTQTQAQALGKFRPGTTLSPSSTGTYFFKIGYWHLFQKWTNRFLYVGHGFWFTTILRLSFWLSLVLAGGQWSGSVSCRVLSDAFGFHHPRKRESHKWVWVCLQGALHIIVLSCVVAFDIVDDFRKNSIQFGPNPLTDLALETKVTHWLISMARGSQPWASMVNPQWVKTVCNVCGLAYHWVPPTDTFFQVLQIMSKARARIR